MSALKPICLVSILCSLVGCATKTAIVQGGAANASIRILHVSDVSWQALNPARGALSPRAGTLWGDRNGTERTGFLAKFVDGFSSPPHIHNVTYRAVVIDGLIHNDDPDAAKLWMGPGSFWTQPAGESHITAARGENNIALVEIDQAPYLVRPPEQSFDNGERPVNIAASNVVWLPSEKSTQPVRISYLWGEFENNQWNGSFIKMPGGFHGTIVAHGEVFHAVVIRGSLVHENAASKILTPGSYVGAQGLSEHRIKNDSNDEVVVYIRTNGRYEVE